MKKLSIGIAVILFIMTPFLAAGATAPVDSPAEEGPTIVLDYGSGQGKANSAADFMYFVPIVSPTLIECQTSNANTQTARLISFRKKLIDDDFVVK